MMRYRNDQGFTLVELLVVIAILALLAIFAVPGIQRASDTARQTQVAEDLQTIQEALEHHYTERGYYPQKLDDLINHGFIKPGFSFRSPTSKHWYFYAVDNNRPSKAQAFLLGNPSKAAYYYNDGNRGNDLHRSGLIPQGRPSHWLAWGWKEFAPNSRLAVYNSETDMDPIDPGLLPAGLHDFRTNCQPLLATAPCDLWSN